MKKGDTGPKVLALQQKILLLNPLALPRFGADSDLGDETLHALAVLLDDDTIEESDVVTAAQLSALDVLVAKERPTGNPGWTYLDRREQASKAERKGKRKRTEYDLVWHQTDCEMGEKPARYDGVPVHFVVTSGGQIIQLHDVDELLYAAHALNKSGISIEVEGHFAGIEGDLSNSSYPAYHKDAGRTPQVMPQVQIEAARQCAHLIKAQLAAIGAKLKRQTTHRQGVKGVRRRDPGEQVCKKVILPLEQGIAPFDWAYTVGQGEQVPTPWHPQSTAKY